MPSSTSAIGLSGYFAAPVYIDGRFVAPLPALRVNMARAATILADKTGLGETGPFGPDLDRPGKGYVFGLDAGGSTVVDLAGSAAISSRGRRSVRSRDRRRPY